MTETKTTATTGCPWCGSIVIEAGSLKHFSDCATRRVPAGGDPE